MPRCVASPQRHDGDDVCQEVSSSIQAPAGSSELLAAPGSRSPCAWPGPRGAPHPRERHRVAPSGRPRRAAESGRDEPALIDSRVAALDDDKSAVFVLSRSSSSDERGRQALGCPGSGYSRLQPLAIRGRATARATRAIVGLSAREDPHRLVDSDDPVLARRARRRPRECPRRARARALGGVVARLGTGGGEGARRGTPRTTRTAGGRSRARARRAPGPAPLRRCRGLTMAVGGAAVAIAWSSGLQSGRARRPSPRSAPRRPGIARCVHRAERAP